MFINVCRPNECSGTLCYNKNELKLLSSCDLSQRFNLTKYESSHIASSIRNDDKIHIHIVGARDSGKTSFVIRVSQNRFDSFYIPSIACEHTECHTMLNYQIYDLKFHVTQFEEFDINKLNDVNDRIIVFYDESSNASLVEAKSFIINTLKKCNNNNNSMNMYLVGNKCDIKHTSPDIINDLNVFCNMYNVQLFHISVKYNTNIPKLLRTIITQETE
jgi:GTPase SAR1 family protein